MKHNSVKVQPKGWKYNTYWLNTVGQAKSNIEQHHDMQLCSNNMFAHYSHKISFWGYYLNV